MRWGDAFTLQASSHTMKTTHPNTKLWKLLATWIVFLLLHYSYKNFPNTLFLVIGEKGETNYFHMKMLFFAYCFVTLAEYLLHRKTLTNPASFVYSRMAIAVLYPWAATTLWFTAQALGFEIPTFPWEIIYSNIITVISIYFALRLEEVLEGVEYRASTRQLITALFLTAILGYVSFSFNTPQHFFTTPEMHTH
ncbi:MAG: hypothetical protein D6755_12375 [Anaerolineae bacterium]|nr:MAG: hypothetical protein D6755_12375 [Anaerolineae bacterium]